MKMTILIFLNCIIIGIDQPKDPKKPEGVKTVIHVGDVAIVHIKKKVAEIYIEQPKPVEDKKECVIL